MARGKPRAPAAPKQDEPIRARDIKPKKIDWLWEQRIPVGHIAICGGKPDMGKGLFAAHLAAYASRKGLNVLYSAMEDSPEQLTRPRLEAAGADLDKVRLLNFFLPGGFDQMAYQVVQFKFRLVIIDPISAHLDGGVVKTTDSIRKVTTPMQKLADRTGCTFVLIEHVVKKISRDAHPLSAIAGTSSGLPAAARMAFLFGKDPKDEDRMVLAPIKHNLRDKPKALAFELEDVDVPLVGPIPMLLAQGELESFNPMDLIKTGEPGKKGRRPEERAKVSEWLTGHLAIHGPLKTRTVLEDAKQVGFKERTVRRAAEDMKVQKSAAGGPNVTWDLPPKLKAYMQQRGGGDGS